jgi:uncharacterized protein YbjT (DUF2867 family)
VRAPSAHKPRVVIAGGSGFVGRALAAALSDRFTVVGLSRTRPRDAEGFDDWRACDLFNLRQAEEALAGADLAIYLVHSMLPSARLSQGQFADFDLLCADNFARAAAKAGVRQLVYLGGLLPEGELSDHLRSRAEVEIVLRRYGTPLTVLRAGLVLGHAGSSFEMLVRLVRRLPIMLLPRWASTRTQPVALDDVVASLAWVVDRPSTFGETYDVGAPETLTYAELIAKTAAILGLRRRVVPLPWMTPRLSRLWISAVTGAPAALVNPLIESLRHTMIARDARLAALSGRPPTSVDVALRRALTAADGKPPSAFGSARGEGSTVRSVQRMELPPGTDAVWARERYVEFLPRLLSGLLRAERDPDHSCRFYLAGLRWPLLVLSFAADRSGPDRQLFFVTGGLLAAPGDAGRFELRTTLEGRTLLTAIHDFRPRLPWWIYRLTQARFHAWVMAAFAMRLRALAASRRAVDASANG